LTVSLTNKWCHSVFEKCSSLTHNMWPDHKSTSKM